MLIRGAYLYRRERKKRSYKYSERLVESESESKRQARSAGSRATSATTGSSEDGSSGQRDEYDTEVRIISIYHFSTFPLKEYNFFPQKNNKRN